MLHVTRYHSSCLDDDLPAVARVLLDVLLAELLAAQRARHAGRGAALLPGVEARALGRVALDHGPEAMRTRDT